MTSLSTKLVTTLEEFEALKEPWNKLVGDMECPEIFFATRESIGILPRLNQRRNRIVWPASFPPCKARVGVRSCYERFLICAQSLRNFEKPTRRFFPPPLARGRDSGTASCNNGSCGIPPANSSSPA